MKAGAADYLVKGRIEAAGLKHSIRYAIERRNAHEALRRSRDELENRVRERTAELQKANAALREADRPGLSRSGWRTRSIPSRRNSEIELPSPSAMD